MTFEISYCDNITVIRKDGVIASLPQKFLYESERLAGYLQENLNHINQLNIPWVSDSNLKKIVVKIGANMPYSLVINSNLIERVSTSVEWLRLLLQTMASNSKVVTRCIEIYVSFQTLNKFRSQLTDPCIKFIMKKNNMTAFRLIVLRRGVKPSSQLIKSEVDFSMCAESIEGRNEIEDLALRHVPLLGSALTSILFRCHNLRHLCLSHCGIGLRSFGKNEFDYFVQSLAKMRYLQILDISYNRLSKKKLQLLVRVLALSLEYLNLAGNSVGRGTVHAIHLLIHLQQLSVEACKFSKPSFRLLLKGLQFMSLTHVDVSQVHHSITSRLILALMGAKSLVELRAHGNRIRPEVLALFCALVYRGKANNLRSAYLPNFQFTSSLEGFSRLRYAIKPTGKIFFHKKMIIVLPRLMQILDLSNIKLKSPDVKRLCGACESGSYSLRELNLSKTQIKCDSLLPILQLSQAAKVQKLDLSSNYLGCDSAHLLSHLLPVCNLTELNLSRCGLSDESLAVLALGVARTKIKSLNLSLNFVTQPACLIDSMISACMSQLDLSNNHISQNHRIMFIYQLLLRNFYCLEKLLVANIYGLRSDEEEIIDVKLITLAYFKALKSRLVFLLGLKDKGSVLFRFASSRLYDRDTLDTIFAYVPLVSPKPEIQKRLNT